MKSLQAYVQTLPETAPEKAILQVKYSAPAFREINPSALLTHAKIVLLKIAVITGWEAPSGDLFTMLNDQLAKHLKESYPTVNPNEVEFAFRQFGSTVTEWGKIVNLTLFDNVMSMYMAARREASEAERNRPVHKPVALLEAPKMTNADKIAKGKEMWESTRKVDFIFSYTFEALVAEGLIKYPLDIVVQRRYWKKAELRMLEHESTDRRFFWNKNRDTWKQTYCRKLVCADYFDGTFEAD